MTGTGPRVPFRPQPLGTLRRRLPGALRRLHDYESMNLGVAPVPGTLPEHCFDFRDGLRLIVGREDSAELGHYLHVSAWVEPAGRLARHLATIRTHGGPALAMNELLSLARLRFTAISRDDGPLDFLGFSSNGWPHWIRKEATR